MLLGTYEHAIDEKGRLFLPAKLRNGHSGDGYVLTRGLETCLYLYEPDRFQSVVAKLGALPLKNQQDARAFKRLLLAGAQEVAVDEMGRILVPKPLLDHARVKKQVAILGVGERIELWAAEAWGGYSRKAAGTFQRLGKQLEI